MSTRVTICNVYGMPNSSDSSFESSQVFYEKGAGWSDYFWTKKTVVPDRALYHFTTEDPDEVVKLSEQYPQYLFVWFFATTAVVPSERWRMFAHAGYWITDDIRDLEDQNGANSAMIYQHFQRLFRIMELPFAMPDTMLTIYDEDIGSPYLSDLDDKLHQLAYGVKFGDLPNCNEYDDLLNCGEWEFYENWKLLRHPVIRPEKVPSSSE